MVEAGRLKKVTKDKSDRTIRYIIAFMHSDLQIRDIRFNQITLDFIEKFNVYLLSTQGLTYNSAAKHLEHLQWTVNKALQNGMMPRNPFNDFRIKKTETQKEYLNKYELGKILSKKFASKRIEKLRDVFIFCCFTGLSYSDAQKATVDNLSRENDGRLWLITYRNKTEVKSTVLLLDIAIKILDKYAEQRKQTGRLLPIISNQKCNEYLKEIADVCEIKKHLKFHCSRHTWTMIAAELEIPKETIAATLGHGGNEVTDTFSSVATTSTRVQFRSSPFYLVSIDNTVRYTSSFSVGTSHFCGLLADEWKRSAGLICASEMAKEDSRWLVVSRTV